MGWRISVAALLAAALALAAWPAPAVAQEGGANASASASAAQVYPAGGEPPPGSPDYAFDGGEVVVSGDSVVSCRDFVDTFDQGYDEYGDQEQARRVLERCEQAGSPDDMDIPPEVRAEIRADRRLGGLPETGGVPAVPLGIGLLIASAGLLVFARRA
jgi:hypothetical protein